MTEEPQPFRSVLRSRLVHGLVVVALLLFIFVEGVQALKTVYDLRIAQGEARSKNVLARPIRLEEPVSQPATDTRPKTCSALAEEPDRRKDFKGWINYVNELARHKEADPEWWKRHLDEVAKCKAEGRAE